MSVLLLGVEGVGGVNGEGGGGEYLLEFGVGGGREEVEVAGKVFGVLLIHVGFLYADHTLVMQFYRLGLFFIIEESGYIDYEVQIYETCVFAYAGVYP